MSGKMSVIKAIDFEESWIDMERIVNELLLHPCQKIVRIEHELESVNFRPIQYSKIYSYIYQLSTQKWPNNCSAKLYIKHGSLLSTFISEVSFPAMINVLSSFDLFFRQLQRCFDAHLALNAGMTNIFLYLDRYYVLSNHLPKTAEVGNKFFRDLFLSPLSAELSRIEMTMDYENPDYHAVVVKLAALSQLGLTLVHNNNNEYSSSASNTIEGQTDMLRDVCRRRGNQWITKCTKFQYTCRVRDFITELSAIFAHPVTAFVNSESLNQILFEELVVKRWEHLLSDFDLALSDWQGSRYFRDFFSVLCMHDMKVQILSFLSIRDKLPLILFTVTAALNLR